VRGRIVVPLLLAGLLLAGCGKRNEPTRPALLQKLTVRVSLARAGDAALFAAEKEGYLRDAGIDAQIQGAKDDAAAIESVAGGQADLAVASEPALLQARDRGLRVISVGGLVRTPLASVVSPRPVKPQDLAGKRVGLADSPYAAAFAKTIGARLSGPLKAATVSGNPTQALAKHKVDVLLGMYLDDPRLPRRNVSVAPIDRFGIPAYNELVLVANEDALGRDGDVFRSVNGAIARATADLRRGRAQAVAAAPGGKAALQAVLPRLGAQQPPDAWKSFAEWMRANGLLKREPNAPAALTSNYLPRQVP
jgi:putative hydroxymethylpyrimidine transport system substrate-binding protein